MPRPLIRPSKPPQPVWGPGGKKAGSPKPGAMSKPTARPANVSPVASLTAAGNRLAGQVKGERKGVYNNPTVSTLQGKLGITKDGDFGPKTKAALKAYQGKNGLNATGILDANTKAKLGMAPKGKKSGLKPASNFQAAAQRMLAGRSLANTR